MAGLGRGPGAGAVPGQLPMEEELTASNLLLLELLVCLAQHFGLISGIPDGTNFRNVFCSCKRALLVKRGIKRINVITWLIKVNRSARVIECIWKTRGTPDFASVNDLWDGSVTALTLGEQVLRQLLAHVGKRAFHLEESLLPYIRTICGTHYTFRSPSRRVFHPNTDHCRWLGAGG